jgi:hypothetical protein
VDELLENSGKVDIGELLVKDQCVRHAAEIQGKLSISAKATPFQIHEMQRTFW